MTASPVAMPVIQSGGRTLSHDTLRENASRAASGLASLGIGKGDTVAICLRNDFAYFEATFAAGLLGAYPVPVNWHATVAEAGYAFEDSGASAILIHADLMIRLGGSIPAAVPVFVVPTPSEIRSAYNIPEGDCIVQPGHTAWQDWVAAQAPYQGEPASAPGTMIYTSGTTGRPKGVRRFPPTTEQAQASFRRLTNVFGLVKRDGDGSIITVVTGPMYHSSPNTHAMISVRQGGQVILQPRFDAEDLLALIERHGVTHLHLVPIMLNRLLRLPEETKRRYDISSLKYVIHTAAPVSPPVKRAMVDWWGPIIHEYYGTSETSILTHCLAPDWLAHPGSVGKPLPDSEIRVVDDSGEPLAAGEIGEIVARVTSIPDFTYHGDDDKRARSDLGGYFAPGDVGYFDPDGFLYICDRAKDMVISGGVNIYPAEIEAELHKMPGVEDCAVFGIPDEDYGESLCVVIQPQLGTKVGADDVWAFLDGKIARYKIPKRVEFRPDLPREDSGKIRKRLLRDEFWKGAPSRV